MRVTTVCILLVLLAFGVCAKRKKFERIIKWKCLDAFNKFRSHAAKGRLSTLIHEAAYKSLVKKAQRIPELQQNNVENADNLLNTTIGPMANVKKLIWDPKLVESAAETAKECHFPGGREGKKNREFSLYYSPEEDYKDIGDMISSSLHDMVPWQKTIMPPTSNETAYFYVGGEFYWASREYIGCVHVACGHRLLLECHMSPGNILEGMPYIEGKPCSKCDPGYTCVDSLCAKEGRVKPKSEVSKSSVSSLPSRYITSIVVLLFISELSNLLNT